MKKSRQFVLGSRCIPTHSLVFLASLRGAATVSIFLKQSRSQRDLFVILLHSYCIIWASPGDSHIFGKGARMTTTIYDNLTVGFWFDECSGYFYEEGRIGTYIVRLPYVQTTMNHYYTENWFITLWNIIANSPIWIIKKCGHIYKQSYIFNQSYYVRTTFSHNHTMIVYIRGDSSWFLFNSYSFLQSFYVIRTSSVTNLIHFSPIWLPSPPYPTAISQNTYSMTTTILRPCHTIAFCWTLGCVLKNWRNVGERRRSFQGQRFDRTSWMFVHTQKYFSPSAFADVPRRSPTFTDARLTFL